MRKSLLIGLALAAALVLALLWQGLRTRATRDGPAGAPAEGSRLEQRAPEPAELRLPDAVPAASAEEQARVALTSAAPGSAPEPGCRLRVVRMSTEEPLPAARVWVQPEGLRWDSHEWGYAMRRLNDVELVLQELGTELALDARGEVFVPRAPHPRNVVAVLGDLHGETALSPKDERCVLRLQPYHSLTVEVVDGAGRPVPGATVVLFDEGDPLRWSTDGDGRVRLPKLEALVPDTYEGLLRVAMAGGARSTPESVEFTLESIPREPVRFVVEECGSVVVELVDLQGRARDLDGHAQLEIDPASRAGPSEVLQAVPGLTAELRHGRAVFTGIGLGLSLDVFVEPERYGNQWRRSVGPTLPGEEVLVRIATLGAARPIARGRVHGVPDDGTGRLGGASSTGAAFGDAVEADGPFEAYLTDVVFDVELDSLRGPWTLTLERKGGERLRAEVLPRIDEVERVLDFGDVQLVPLTALATLHAVDDAGRALSHAAIEIEGVAGRAGSCDESGTCRLTGESVRFPLRVRATGQGTLASAWAVLDAPGRELTLVVPRAAELRGRLVLPTGYYNNDGELDLDLGVEPDDALAKPARHSTSPDADGEFRFNSLEPGRGALTVAYSGTTLHERADIALVGGQVTELEPIDLAARLHRFELAFELEDGAPWRGGHLEFVARAGELPTWITIGREGRALVFAAELETLDLWVAALGARPTRFEDVRDGDRLVLPRGLSLRLRLAAGLSVPDPLVLSVDANRVDEEVGEDEQHDVYQGEDVAPVALAPDGTALIEVPWPGEYELIWHVSDGEKEIYLGVHPSEPLRIQGEAGDPVEVSLPRARLEEAVRELLGG